MKFLCERDALKDALSFVVSRTKGIKNMPILQHILFETGAQKITLTGHDLASCSQATIRAEVSQEGAVALPADRLHQLVGGLPSGAQFALEFDGSVARATSGRSSYRFSTLPAADFPSALALDSGVTITPTKDQVRRIFKTSRACMSSEQTRPYLCGVFLHPEAGGIASCVTDGQVLVKVSTKLDAEHFVGIIIPESACDEIAKLGGDGGVSLTLSTSLISVTVGDRRFVSKLIDGTYPDYKAAIPQANAPTVTVETQELESALARLLAAQDPEAKRIIRFDLDAKAEHLAASMTTTLGRGEEKIECDAQERAAPSYVGFQAENLRKIAEGMGAERMRLFIGEAGEPVRVEDPDNADVVGVCYPYRI